MTLTRKRIKSKTNIMKKLKLLELEMEIIVALLEAGIKTGKPTVREVIGYIKRKYKLYEPKEIIDLDKN